MAIRTGQLAVLACTVALIWRAAAAASAPAVGVVDTAQHVVVADRPTPVSWDQWLPKTDDSDSRLQDHIVSLWQPDLTLRDVLAEIGTQASVRLTTVADLGDTRLTVFLSDCGLDGLMVALADLCDAYWAFPRGADPAKREYCLVGFREPEPVDAMYESQMAALRRARAANQRALRERRLELYAEALSLPPEQVIEKYGVTDPWICADLLNPAARPMIEMVCSLAPGAREALLTEGEISIPLSRLPIALQAHLARWAKGTWGVPGMQERHPDPDRLPRFDRPEDRWTAATFRLWWSRTALKGFLDVPDLARFDADVIQTTKRPPGGARLTLLGLGYERETPEYRERVLQEDRAWREKWGSVEAANRDDPPPYYLLSPSPDDADSRVQAMVDLAAEGAPATTAADCLAAAARQCDMSVIAHFLPAEQYRRDVLEAAADEVRLGDLLADIREQRSGAFSWDFRGPMLLCRDAEYRFLQAGVLSEQIRQRWLRWAREGELVPLDRFASALSELNPAQMETLALSMRQLESLHLPLDGLRLYGLLGDRLGRLSDAAGLSSAELTPEEQRSLQRIAHRSHPWVDQFDLEGAVLRTLPRKLSTGEDGITFIVEYPQSALGNDRDVVFTAPLKVSVAAPHPVR